MIKILLLQAYRLEPLILKHYSTIEPLRIHRIDAASKTRYDLIPPQPYKAVATGAASPPSALSPARSRPDGGGVGTKLAGSTENSST